MKNLVKNYYFFQFDMLYIAIIKGKKNNFISF